MMIVGASQTEFNENVATAFRQGRDLERQGDIPKALQQYEQILEADPFHIATLIQLCDLLLEQDREDDALEFCRTLFGSETHELIADITAFPISEVALLRLAAIYLGAERPEIGRIILEHTARKHPEFIDAAVGLASILHEERNYGAAASVMRKTAEANPDKAELWFDLAQFELRANSIT
ncbi:MAG: tetratricopeptide repeat protein, partial [Rhodospirillaceae bacterium]|nr:tetratricopeptide repeat protein [Rhodospirillaceae bacterium]